jgi:hypothetical protein
MPAGTLPEELRSSGVTRMVGQREDYAADVVPECGEHALVTTYQFLKEEIVSAKLIVGNTAIELKAGTNRLSKRKTIIIKPFGKIYIGGAGVTTANGFELAPRQTFIISASENVAIYSIAVSDTETDIIEGA